MSGQRYATPTALDRMASGLCPECGERPDQHLNDPRFWIPRRCDLLPIGVAERIAQYQRDQAQCCGDCNCETGCKGVPA